MSITKATNSGLVGTKYNNVSADNYYMEPIASVLVGSGGQASISFTNIPQGYKHLQIRGIARSNKATGGDNAFIRFNSDSSASYTIHQITGDGASASAYGAANQTYSEGLGMEFPTGTANASIFGVAVIDILDYANVNKFKTTRTLTGADANGSGSVQFRSGLWMSTSPITSITISPTYSTLLNQYSRLSLYGIRG